MSTKEREKSHDEIAHKMGAAIRRACSSSFGDLSGSFLCRSIGSLNPVAPICVKEDASIKSVIDVLKSNRIGSVVVVDSAGKLCGIFTERDCVLKVLDTSLDFNKTAISSVMTRDPVTEVPETTIAFALNLMSHGGFRHIPIVDADKTPVGIVSVKDVVDYLVQSLTEDLLGLEVEE